MRRCALTALLLAATTTPLAAEHPPVSGQVTFLYYEDLDRARSFYGDVLGLEKTFELGWVSIFQVSSSSSVGVVNASGGSLRPSGDKPVMLSLVVEPKDVDRWYEYLKAKGVEVGDPPKAGAEGNIRAFAFEDPEGYALEIFGWVR